MPALELREYEDDSARSPFASWFNRLNSVAAARVTTALYRLANGNFSNVKSVGEGVFELRIDFGPGYRVYFGQEGDLVVLLGGGTKRTQSKDISRAQAHWRNYHG